MNHYRQLTMAESNAYTERIYRARQGEDFNHDDYDPIEQRAIFNALQTAETQLVTPTNAMHDYGHGTACVPDEIHATVTGAAALLSSEHATRSWHIADDGKKSPKAAEPGTAALGRLAALQTGGTHIAMIGRQTGNANVEASHPYKQVIERLISGGKYGAFISIHGMRTGLVSDLCDERPYDMLLGIGENPTNSSLHAAGALSVVAKRLGLRVAINQPFLDIVKRGGKLYQQVNADGAPVTQIFEAPRYTTRATAQRVAEANGHDLPTIQVELSGAVRVLPGGVGEAVNPNPIGPYLAYMALRRALPLFLESTHNPSL